MKTIILVRHATAESKAVDKEDFERSLTRKGRKEAETMSQWYEKNGQVPDLLLSSPANRAVETARIFAKKLGYAKKKIMLNESLYSLSDPDEFLRIVRALDDKHGSVMVFGHDPSFSDFAKHMVKEFSDDLPKCGVFTFRVNRKKWETVQPGEGTCLYFEHPQRIHARKEEEKARRRDIAARIEKSIQQVLGRFGIESSDKEHKKIHRVSTRLARAFAPRARTAAPAPERGKKAGAAKEKSK